MELGKKVFFLFLLLSVSYGHAKGKNSAKFSSIAAVEVNVTKVHDGDTFTAYIPFLKGDKIIRIEGLDCFELVSKFTYDRAQKQADYFKISMNSVKRKGLAATNLLKKLLKKSHNRVTLVINLKHLYGYYGRIIANVVIDGKDINETMIKSGFCYKYKNLK